MASKRTPSESGSIFKVNFRQRCWLLGVITTLGGKGGPCAALHVTTILEGRQLLGEESRPQKAGSKHRCHVEALFTESECKGKTQ